MPSFKTAVVKSLLVSEDAGSGTTITVTLVNASGAIFNLFKDKAIASNIESGDFDITQRAQGVADIRGDGEFLMKIRRFIPDFISQTGTTTITLQLRNFPNDSQSSSALGPFDITSSTKKIDTRARARAIALKVANTSTSQNWKLGTFRLDIQPDGRR